MTSPISRGRNDARTASIQGSAPESKTVTEKVPGHILPASQRGRGSAASNTSAADSATNAGTGILSSPRSPTQSPHRSPRKHAREKERQALVKSRDAEGSAAQRMSAKRNKDRTTAGDEIGGARSSSMPVFPSPQRPRAKETDERRRLKQSGPAEIGVSVVRDGLAGASNRSGAEMARLDNLMKLAAQSTRKAYEVLNSDAEAAYLVFPEQITQFLTDELDSVSNTQAFRGFSDAEKQRALRNLTYLCLAAWDRTLVCSPVRDWQGTLKNMFQDVYGRSSEDLAVVLKQDFYAQDEKWLGAHLGRDSKVARAQCQAFVDLLLAQARENGLYRTLNLRKDLYAAPYLQKTRDFILWVQKKAAGENWKEGLKIDIEQRSPYFFSASGDISHSMRSVEEFCARIHEPALQPLLGVMANQNLTGFILNQFFLHQLEDGSYHSVLNMANGNALSAPNWAAEYLITRIPGGYKLRYSGTLGLDSKGQRRTAAREIVSQKMLNFFDPTLQMHLTVRVLHRGQIEFGPFVLEASNWHKPLPESEQAFTTQPRKTS